MFSSCWSISFYIISPVSHHLVSYESTQSHTNEEERVREGVTEGRRLRQRERGGGREMERGQRDMETERERGGGRDGDREMETERWRLREMER